MSTPPVAIVTGSSSGIGEGIARALAADGHTVVVNSATSVDAGERLAAELPGASYVQADVADPADAVRLVETTVERHGRLDLLVNHAGVSRPVPHADLDAITADDWHRILGVNVVGTWQVSVAAVKAMKPGGLIVNITSVGGSRPLGSSIPYSVSKAALDHLTRLLAKAVGPNIRPGPAADPPDRGQPRRAGRAHRGDHPPGPPRATLRRRRGGLGAHQDPLRHRRGDQRRRRHQPHHPHGHAARRRVTGKRHGRGPGGTRRRRGPRPPANQGPAEWGPRLSRQLLQY
jgi:ketoreductase RED2